MNNTMGNDFTEDIKDRFEKIIFATKDEIRIFSNDIKTARADLDKLDEIAKELNNIAGKIRDIKKELIYIERSYNNRKEKLDEIWDEVKNVDIILGLNPYEQMFNSIEINLPDDIYLESDDINEKCRRIIQKKEKKEKKKIIGSIEAIGDKDIDFLVKIEVNDFIATTQIANTSKIYTIINFINEKLNYKSDEFTVEKKYEDKSNMVE